MASTYSPLLGIELIGIGDQNNTWGTTNNTNLGTLIEQAIAGTATIDVTAGNVTLTDFDGAADQSRCAALRVVGNPGVSRNIVAPASSKIYVVANGSDAAVVLKSSVSTGLTIPAGEVYLAYYDPTVGTADFRLVGRASASTNTANTLVLRDGSGNFAAGTITANLTGDVSGTLTGAIASATTATTQTTGTSNTSVATTAFVQNTVPSGVILMWSGSVGSIPAGWLLCNGASGTPDLRGRFLVGAGGSYSVGATGGSADAVVVSHSHSASTSISDPGHAHTMPYSSGVDSPKSVDNTPSEYGRKDTTTSTYGAYTGISAGTTVNAAGVSGANANLPPYYALCYIMKA